MDDPLSQTFAALADPTRRAILARLAEGEATVNQLAAPFDISLPAISRHLKVLEAAGLITRGRAAQWRPCKLEAAPLRALDGWLDGYRAMWEGSFDKMDTYLKLIQGEHNGNSDGSKPGSTGKGNPGDS
ncbi:ArsR/SmtB family transcription factor [Pseudoduganella buxea]|uniref:Metalloregulator ArsR/SmtB family transcription factor n=1 Tax=Pseudoduganella buxea TaxID=1949069 RepID=A0A6I3T365_9BURK|nr:metalloregulator ArsR/SmtB family transcription factor [Pseudoduganella buxea]MTV56058.1 metalloregulator ArsR/SmtB family transcription factor [Pseudoduganella buxea]GGC19391.1 transcriptional regulator [Pseudoduganella buxea]